VAADHAGGHLTDIQRAARFLLPEDGLWRQGSGQTFGTASTSPPRMNLLRIEEELSAAALARTYVEHLDWKSCIQYDRPHTLFYADPPYWQTAGYGCRFR
jgi:DNA adenine methylase